jgi:hypothetical protein
MKYLLGVYTYIHAYFLSIQFLPLQLFTVIFMTTTREQLDQEPLAWCKVNTNIFSLFPLLRFSRKPKEDWNPLYTKKQLDAAFALGAAQEPVKKQEQTALL